MGTVIGAHRWYLLSQALGIAAWVFEGGTEEHQELLRSSALAGLGFLRRALVFQEISPHPFVEQPQVSEDEVDVPLLRWRCVQLAKAMHSAGLRDEAVCSRLADGRRERPLAGVALRGGGVARRSGFKDRARLRLRVREWIGINGSPSFRTKVAGQEPAAGPRHRGNLRN